MEVLDQNRAAPACPKADIQLGAEFKNAETGAYLVALGMRVIFASMLLMFPLHAQATPSAPNDCWFGLMAPEKAPHAQFVATGSVAQRRVGMSLVVYSIKENYDQSIALAEKGGGFGTFDTSRPITIIPTWISGPEPGDKGSEADKRIEVMMKYRTYRTAQDETGTIDLTYWTSMSGN